jgi:hypothetical protein
MRRMLALALVALAAAACGSAAAGESSPARFAGYKWSVVAIRHDGRETPVPARYNVYLQFAPNGQYGANDPVNYHLGTYRPTGDGFATGHVATTLAGYAGKDPVTLLAMAAISSLDADTSATVLNLGAATIAIAVNGYTLTCQRAGEQPNFPPAART